MQPVHINPIHPAFVLLASLSLLCATPPIAAQERADGGVAGAMADLGGTSPPTAESGGPELIGNAITYQAQIKQSGVPIDGLCDLQFSLWNALSGPAQVGSTVTQLNQNVNEGVFTADLNFGAGAFDGNDRWLQMAVRFPAGSGSYQTLVPRQKINAAPYALWSMSGAGGVNPSLPWIDSGSANNQGLIEMTNTHANGAGIFGRGVQYGVAGLNYTSGMSGSLGRTEAGVYGYGIPPHAFTGAVFGEVPSNGTTESSAIRGINHSPWGYGVNGTHEGNGYGVFGITYTNGRGVYGQGSGSEGVRGLNVPQNTLGILGYSGSGVYGEHGATANRGYLGTATQGVYGVATSNTSYGVYGANTGGGYAGFFDGWIAADVVQVLGADLAEKFNISGGTEPGTVVVIDAANPGALRNSSKEYDRCVAGIISGAGGINAVMFKASIWHGTAASWEDLSLLLTGSWSVTQAESIWKDTTAIYVAGHGFNLVTNNYEALLWTRPILECPGDITDDATVNIDDLLEIVNFWGSCPGPCPPHCTADINDDCLVNIDDLLNVINYWGACP